jgi:hypothetical protein
MEDGRLARVSLHKIVEYYGSTFAVLIPWFRWLTEGQNERILLSFEEVIVNRAFFICLRSRAFPSDHSLL